MKKVVINPLGQSALVNTGSKLLSALLAKDLKVLMSCGGRGICSTCHVRVCSGMENLSPVGPAERRTLALVADAGPDSRLACQAVVYGDGVEVRVPEGMYIEKADDLLSLLGTPAPENILHPITGAILIPKGKLITRTLLEQSRRVDQDMRRLREGTGPKEDTGPTEPTTRHTFTASGVGSRPNLTGTTQFLTRTTVERTPQPAPGPAPADPVSTPTPVVPTPPLRAEARRPASDPNLGLTSRTPAAPPPAPTPPPVATPPTIPYPMAASARPAEIRPGTQLGKYLLLECVGKGGAGVVYRALHTTLKTLVAVKFLRPEIGSSDGTARERLAHEAQLLARLCHPNVVRVFDYEDDPVRPYVVMEFVEGLSAAELIRQSGRITWSRAVRIAHDAAAGLDAAHRIGIIHRDVKPGNILVTREGTSKLVDLGLATMHRPELAATGPAGEAGSVEGTVGYMAPEALTGGHPDHRSDIYSLGATLFHLISGRLPFTGRSPAEVIMRHLQQPPPVLHEVVPEVPPRLSAVIQTMMAKNPASRYQTYTELLRELGNLVAAPAPAEV